MVNLLFSFIFRFVSRNFVELSSMVNFMLWFCWLIQSDKRELSRDHPLIINWTDIQIQNNSAYTYIYSMTKQKGISGVKIKSWFTLVIRSKTHIFAASTITQYWLNNTIIIIFFLTMQPLFQSGIFARNLTHINITNLIRICEINSLEFMQINT